MIDRGKQNIAGVLIDAVDYDAAVARIVSAAKERRSMAVSALAVHGVMTGVLDDTHRYRLNHLDLVVPDGQPVRWALNSLHKAGLSDRVYGPNLTLKLCEAAAAESLPIYLYGSKASVLSELSRNLCQRFPGLKIAGAEPSRFRCLSEEEKLEVAQRISESGARITFVGLGCPRQEVWVYEYRDLLKMPMLAVGAAFDFHARTVPQAPEFLQRAGLEWLFRLVREPRRLWRRYLFLNPYYTMLVLSQAAGLRRFDPEATPPTAELRYG
ncbi:MAG TPA: WecB/TagA/CpsF family glycosyltransferase [Terriglobales bacterium]|nr:WecB/TagA/CpsF family glycosyltransferase [Terriglobales bacterium]